MGIAKVLWSRTPSSWFLLVLAGFFQVPTDASAQQAPFDEAIIQRWKEYERFSRTLQGTRRESTSIHSGSGKSHSQVLHFRQNQECALLVHLLDKELYETITLASRLYAAELRRNVSDPTKVVLVRCEEDPNAVLHSGDGMPVSDDVFLITSPHMCYSWTRLYDLVSKPTFQVKGVSRETHDGKELVRVEFAYVYEEPHTQYRRQGALYFDPSQCWCLQKVRETEVAFRDGVRYRTMDWDILYETDSHPSGFPLTKSYSTKFDGYYEKDKRPSGGTITGQYELESDAHVPDSEFTLTAFGLPEPALAGRKKLVPTYVWFLVAAAACAVLAYGLRRLTLRGRAASRKA